MKKIKTQSLSRAARKVEFMRNQMGLCIWCGQRITGGQVSFEHIVPKSLGGTLSQLNTCVAHILCNNNRMSDTQQKPDKFVWCLLPRKKRLLFNMYEMTNMQCKEYVCDILGI